RCDDAQSSVAEDAESGDEGSFVEQLQKRRRLAAVEPRTTYGQERHSLQPITLEMLLFLHQNEQYWSAQTVDEATR
ncbi:hypothetical protein PF006_g30804, partial [Phytophthora fragariae]